MKNNFRRTAIALALATAGLGHVYAAQEFIPTGMNITPTEAAGAVLQTLNPDLPNRPDFVADHAVDMVTSPDGKTLLVLTSGYNRNNNLSGRVAEESNEYVFIYDIVNGNPVKKQVLQVPNTFNGIVWNPNGQEFYVSGGVSDSVHIYSLTGGTWAENGTEITLGHTAGEGLAVAPMAAGLSVNASGTHLLVANYENDSISLINLATRAVVNQLDLRPGKLDATLSGTPGGTFPFAVQFKGDNKAYVTSVRDREVVVVNVAGEQLSLAKRIKTAGQPNKMTLNTAMTKLFIASDNDDMVLVVNTVKDKIIETIPTIAPKALFKNIHELKGANPNNLKLSPNENLLYVTNGGTNSVAVIKLDDENKTSKVIGLIPTGWYPSAVATNKTGTMLYVSNAKGIAGPNPEGCRDNLLESGGTVECNAANQYVWQLEKASLLTMPVPKGPELNRLSWQVAENSHFPKAKEKDELKKVAKFLNKKIEHIIYIVKENRTYDQVLGDLAIGNGDPTMAILSPYSPNHKKLALDFFTLDNFYDSGETSGVGWNWTTAARTTDFTEKTQPVNYAGRGLSYDWEGGNRNINVAQATLAERIASNPFNPNDADVLAGTADVAAPDSEGEAGAGYLWDAALRAHKTIRNYGFYVGNLNDDSASMSDEVLAHPFANNAPQVVATNKALAPYTDVYFRGYDQVNADFYLYKEWEREFDQYAAKGELPNLSFVRFPHDHFGSFTSAKFGVNTIETQMADNDYATALVIDKIAHSSFKNNTLIVIVEDDAQGGGDHIDPHRSIAYIVGPYVKQGALISTHYTTVNLIHTMTEILGLNPLNINDGLARFMDVFDTKQKDWTYDAIVPEILYTTSLPLPPQTVAKVDSGKTQCDTKPLRSAGYWNEHMSGQNFAVEDKLDVAAFNRVLWQGLKGDTAVFPNTRSGADLRSNRSELLAKYQAEQQTLCNSSVASR